MVKVSTHVIIASMTVTGKRITCTATEFLVLLPDPSTKAFGAKTNSTALVSSSGITVTSILVTG